MAELVGYSGLKRMVILAVAIIKLVADGVSTTAHAVLQSHRCVGIKVRTVNVATASLKYLGEMEVKKRCLS